MISSNALMSAGSGEDKAKFFGKKLKFRYFILMIKGRIEGRAYTHS